MKLRTWFHPDPSEVEVDISTEDIVRLLAETPDRKFTALQFLNKMAQTISAISDEIIAEMNPAQRETIAEFLTTQAVRYRRQVAPLILKTPTAVSSTQLFSPNQ